MKKIMISLILSMLTITPLLASGIAPPENVYQRRGRGAGFPRRLTPGNNPNESAEEREDREDYERYERRSSAKTEVRNTRAMNEKEFVDAFQKELDSETKFAKTWTKKKGYTFVNEQQLYITPERYKGKKIAFVSLFSEFEKDFYKFMDKAKLTEEDYVYVETCAPMPMLYPKKKDLDAIANLQRNDYIVVCGKMYESVIYEKTKSSRKANKVYYMILDDVRHIEIDPDLKEFDTKKQKGGKSSKFGTTRAPGSRSVDPEAGGNKSLETVIKEAEAEKPIPEAPKNKKEELEW